MSRSTSRAATGGSPSPSRRGAATPDGVVQVNIWVRRPADVPDGSGILDEHERRCHAAIVAPGTRAAYAAAHALARRAVAEVAESDPASVRFDRRCAVCGAPHGRPRLVDHPGLHVSLTRTDRVVAVAVARDLPVGVDAELLAATGFAGFAGVALHPGERDRIELSARAGTEGDSQGPSLARARAWTRKESALKALGVGLRTDPAGVRTPPSGIPTDLDGAGSWVTVADVPVPWTGVAVAVALAGRATGIALRMR